MRKFTPTEIDLCKKIVEKERKEIQRGDWVADELENICLVEKRFKTLLTINEDGDCAQYGYLDDLNVVPLWQEHDCLEWLREKGFEEFYVDRFCDGKVEAYGWHKDTFGKIDKQKGKAPLEALLRAVLAVMKEAKP